jgi:hypothetical protein
VRCSLAAAALLGCTGCNGALISLLPEEDVFADAKTPPGGPVDAAGETDSPAELGSQWLLGSSASDSIGNNDGTLVGGASFGSDATRAGFLVCNGTNAAVRVANQTTNSFTFTAWIWSDVPSSKGSTAIDGDALIWSNVSGKDDDFALAVLNDHLSYINYGQTSTGSASLTDSKWHQVAVTRQDGARVQLYVDGVLDGDGNSGTGPVLANPYVFFCGVDSNGGHFFHGKMSNVRFYRRVLSAAEVGAAFVSQK